MNIAFYRLVSEDDKPILQKLSDIKVTGTIYGKNPQDIADWFKNALLLDKIMQEEVFILFLHNSLRVKGISLISKGLEDSAIICKSSLFREVLLSGASKIIIVHNHPSGDTKPSKEDIQFTSELRNGCKLLGISLLDHIIIGDYYTSFRENGLLEVQ